MIKSSIFFKDINLFKNWKIFLILFAIFFRLYGSFNNHFSNDNHYEVIEKYQLIGQSPHINDCFQCYHPKVFHYPFYLVKTFFKLSSADVQMLGRLSNSILSLLVLYLILSIVNIRNNSIIFLLLLINSNYSGISIQFTNDLFATFFSTVFLFILYHFHLSTSVRVYALMSVFVLLALNSKGTALASFTVYLLYSLWSLIKLFNWKKALIFIFVCLQALFYSEYSYNYRNSENFLLTNMPNKTLNDSSYFVRNFLMLPVIDVLKEPHLGHRTAKVKLQDHASNIWSSLYGRLLSEQFSSYPIRWSNFHPFMIWLRRLLLILGLSFIYLFVKGCMNIVREVKLKKEINGDVLMLTSALLQLLLYFSYTLLKLHSSANKAIYLYPAILSFSYVLSKGMKFTMINKILHVILFLFFIESVDILLRL